MDGSPCTYYRRRCAAPDNAKQCSLHMKWRRYVLGCIGSVDKCRRGFGPTIIEEEDGDQKIDEHLGMSRTRGVCWARSSLQCFWATAISKNRKYPKIEGLRSLQNM